jgi:uncharacterized protein (DUF885 family)
VPIIAAAQARHGDGFDLKAFHRFALDLGPLGLDDLGAELATAKEARQILGLGV